MEATVDVALKDTQEDEYYGNIVQDGIRKTFRLLRENPYPGLRPFKTSESNVFFGRKEITFELISRLATNRFLAVLGASGSGKSSLVRAGLLPGLKTLPGKHSLWKVAVCRPGKNPFGNLAISIGKAGIAPALSNLDIWKYISSSSYGFEEMYQGLPASNEYNTLIVIDQFEELFRFKKDNGTTGKNDAALFVKMLIDVSKIQSLNTYVMITMRSEYLGDCVQFPDLVDEINSGQFLVPRLKINQLKDAIMEPAGFANAAVDPVCANRLIGEIGDNMDQLPVLQHALRRSYGEAQKHIAERGGIRVMYADYDAIGRMENALDKHAEEILQNFDESQKKYCRILFQSITDRATDGRGIRRPLSFATIYKICTESKSPDEDDNKIKDDLKKVIEQFRADSVNFLMPPENVPLQDNTEIDISHESLMRIWKQLVTWIEKEARDADLLKLLLSKEENEYITGGRLLSFQEWVALKRNAFTWAGIYKPASITGADFTQKFTSKVLLIDKSVEIDKEEQAKKELEQERLLEEQRMKARRRLNYIFLIAALLLITITGIILLLSLYRKLDDSKKDVITANQKLKGLNDTISLQLKNVKGLNDTLNINKIRLDATIDELSQQQAVLKGQKKSIENYSALLSKNNSELTRKIDELDKEQTRSATLNNSLQKVNKDLQTTSTQAQNLQNLALAVQHAEKSLSIPDYDQKRKDIKAQLALVSYKLLQASGRIEIQKLQPQIYTGLYNAIKGSSEGPAQVRTISKYAPGTDRQAFAGTAAGNNSAPLVYLTAEDKNLYSYNLQTGETDMKELYTNKNLFSVEINKQGRWLAINTLSRELVLRNLQQQKNVDTLLTFGGTVRCAKFSPDGNSLFVFTKDSMLHKVDLKNLKGSTAHQSRKINHLVEDMAISNQFIYAITSTGDVIKWNTSISQSDKDYLISTPLNVNNRTRFQLLDKRKNVEKKYRGTKIGCSEDDEIVVWGNEEGEVFYYEPNRSATNTGLNLTRFVGPITDIAFSTTGDYLAVASYDKSIRVFQLAHLQAEAPMYLSNNEGPVTAIFFRASKDNPVAVDLYAVMSPGIIRMYPMDLNTLACTLEKTNIKELTPDDKVRYFDEQARDKLTEIACRK